METKKSYRMIIELKPEPIDWRLGIGINIIKNNTTYVFKDVFVLDFLFISIVTRQFNHGYK